MSFKIPTFENITTLETLIGFLRTIFARWSTSDLLADREVTIIGWNMDTTASITVNYKGTNELFDFNRLKVKSLMIYKDGLTEKYDGQAGDGIESIKIDSTNITITRKTGGFYDNANFDDDTVDRGEIVLCYSI